MPHTVKLLSHLIYQFECLEDFERVIVLRRKEIDLMAESDSVLLSTSIHLLSGDYIRIESYEAAWGALLWSTEVKAPRFDAQTTNWASEVETAFDIVIGAGPKSAISRSAFVWAYRKLINGCRVTKRLFPSRRPDGRCHVCKQVWPAHGLHSETMGFWQLLFTL